MSFAISKLYDAVVTYSEWRCLADWRRELVASLSGSVLEIGAGTGRNLAHYGPDIRHLVLAEPDRHMRAQLEKRLGKVPRGYALELCDHPAEELLVPAASFDAVVATMVLCSVREPERSIAESYRVLRPGGRLLLIEHIRAPEHSNRRRWQERLGPIWPRVSGGCHLERDPRESLLSVGFEVEHIVLDELRGAPPFLRTVVRGSWIKPTG